MRTSIKKIKKDWGYELWLVNNKEEDYCGKILCINEGCKGSMHFHANKHETFYILEGKLKIEIEELQSWVQPEITKTQF